MKPPYGITSKVVQLVASISEMIGEVNANFLNKQSPELRKQHKVKTIHSSLQIEGNTLTEDQITALIENKRVIGPAKDVTEVMNAIRVYDNLDNFKSGSEKDFLKAHKILTTGLIVEAGKYRTKGVGIVKGSEIAHIVPPAGNVAYLMKDLFSYLKTEEIALIRSCVFHYEMEFIHPFTDGNGRMGRLWQTVILKDSYPVFEFLPFETLISKNQARYYEVLSLCDKSGSSTMFIEYMLEIIRDSLSDLLSYNSRTMKDVDRIDYFLGITSKKFSRKDYMNTFKAISTATASRDLKKATDSGLISKEGDQRNSTYRKL